MRRRAWRSAAACLAVCWALAADAIATQAYADDPTRLVRAALDLACAARGRDDLQRLGSRLVGGRSSVRPLVTRLTWGRRWTYPLADGVLVLDWITPPGQRPHIRLQYDGAQGSRPEILAIVDYRCALRTARRLHYGQDGGPTWLEELDGTLQPNGHREALNPPVPAHADPGGLPVAIVDTGVNYLLPEINRRLARDASGMLVGYDFWDLDDRPFDVHPRGSAFFPDRHGTMVASIVLAEAPVARLLPYRYPRPDMARLAALIDHAARHGARIVNLSLTSLHRKDWAGFEAAVIRHPEMLFVVAAGNDNRDIDRRPVYPAALQFENLITVTAARADGRLARGVNWGPRTVDLMVDADDIHALGFDGRIVQVSGSSYATARLTALAACLLAARPATTVARLREQIFGLAQVPGADGYVAKGFIGHRTARSRGACPDGAPASGI